MFEENFAIFLADFGVPVRWTLAAGTSFETRAIFDRAEMTGELGNARVVAVQPRLSCPLSEIDGVARGDAVEILDSEETRKLGAPVATFRVLEIINEGTGWSTVVLK